MLEALRLQFPFFLKGTFTLRDSSSCLRSSPFVFQPSDIQGLEFGIIHMIVARSGSSTRKRPPGTIVPGGLVVYLRWRV